MKKSIIPLLAVLFFGCSNDFSDSSIDVLRAYTSRFISAGICFILHKLEIQQTIFTPNNGCIWGIEWNDKKIDFMVNGEVCATYYNKGLGAVQWPFASTGTVTSKTNFYTINIILNHRVHSGPYKSILQKTISTDIPAHNQLAW